MRRTGPLRLRDGGGEQVGNGAGRGALDRAHDDVADPTIAEGPRQADQGDHPLDGAEGHHERHRTRVAEAVGPSQPLERVAQESPPPTPLQGGAGVVPAELPGLGNELSRAHAGTRTVIAPGSTRNLSRDTYERLPPSSS